MNYYKLGRKRSCPNFSYWDDVHLPGLKTTITLCDLLNSSIRRYHELRSPTTYYIGVSLVSVVFGRVRRG